VIEVDPTVATTSAGAGMRGCADDRAQPVSMMTMVPAIAAVAEEAVFSIPYDNAEIEGRQAARPRDQPPVPDPPTVP